MLDLILNLDILPRAFYERPAKVVARALVGTVVVFGECAGRIVETEAYLGLKDPASHAYRGLTPRTRVMFGPAGHAYVYFVYGMHECLNVVCEADGSPGCVLIRALEPLAGIELMQARRGAAKFQELMSGPGKLTQAMGITRAQNGADFTMGEFTIRRGDLQGRVRLDTGPRVGIREALDWPLRFGLRGSGFVSRPRI